MSHRDMDPLNQEWRSENIGQPSNIPTPGELQRMLDGEVAPLTTDSPSVQEYHARYSVEINRDPQGNDIQTERYEARFPVDKPIRLQSSTPALSHSKQPTKVTETTVLPAVPERQVAAQHRSPQLGRLAVSALKCIPPFRLIPDSLLPGSEKSETKRPLLWRIGSHALLFDVLLTGVLTTATHDWEEPINHGVVLRADFPQFIGNPVTQLEDYKSRAGALVWLAEKL